MNIRDAGEADLPEILDIFNQVILTSTAIYHDQPVSIEDRALWLAARQRQGFPVLVAEQSGAVQGFASFGEFRGAWPGYRHTVEHTVHVIEDGRGKGTGWALMNALIPRAQAMNMHVMIGGIDAANEASLRFHERLGFERAAHFREVGAKFGRWLDLVFMQKFLDQAAQPQSR